MVQDIIKNNTMIKAVRALPRFFSKINQMLVDLFFKLFYLYNPRRSHNYFICYLISIPFVLLAFLIRIKLDSLIGDKNPFLLFFAALILGAWYGGIRGGFVATITSLLLADIVYIEPYYNFNVIEPIENLSLLIFFLEGILISIVSEVLHLAIDKTQQQTRIARKMARKIKAYHKKTFDILESISDSFIGINNDWKFTYINKTAEKVLGRKGAELIGKKIWEVYSNLVDTDGYKKIYEAYTTNKPIVYEEPNLIQDKIFEVHVYPSDEGGLGIYFSDVTERKRKESELQEKTEYYERLAESEIVGIVISDFKGNIFHVNDAFLNMIEYTKEDLIDRKIDWDSITPEEYKDIDEISWDEIKSKGFTQPFEKEYFTKTGKRVPVLVGIVIIDKNAGTCLGFVLDITERRELEKRKDEFLSIVSHELKTPLTTIKAFTQILQLQLKDNKVIYGYLEKMDSQIDRLTGLIKDTIDVSKIQAGKLELRKEEFDVDLLVDETINNLQIANNTHTIIKEGKIDVKINADRNRIEQVLTNLINNAIKYSPNSNEILVAVTADKKDVKVDVTDYGIGISEKEQQNIFERFYRVKNVSEDRFYGLGLGLYISNDLVNRHGGQIKVKSKEGEGSTFSVILPL